MSVTKLSRSISRGYANIYDAYGIDIRSLALFRIAVGLVVLIDLVRRFQHASILYSDEGVLPRTDAISTLNPARWSLLFLNGTTEFVNLFIILGIAATVAMILGWKTRIAVIVVWVVVMSLQVRNNGVIDGSDNLIRVTLFWAMFLPLGNVWSLDSQNSESSGGSKTQSVPVVIASVAGFGFILQQAYVYWFTAMLKDGPRWVEEGTALYYALGMNHVNRASGEWLFQHAPHWLLTTLTFSTLVLEYAVPIMLLLPLKNGLLRTIAVFLLLSLHSGIFIFMHVELFPLISIASSLALLPNYFWENVLPRLKPVVPAGLLQLLPSFGEVPGTVSPGLGSARLQNSDRYLGSLHFKHQFPGSSVINAYVTTAICVVAIVLSTLGNIANVTSFTVPPTLGSITWAAGLQQSWRMFAPQPGTNTVWYIVEGELDSGTSIDLYTAIAEDDVSIASAVVWDQSSNVINPDKFWHKYFTWFQDRTTPKSRYAKYVCQTWNAEPPGNNRITGVNLFRATSQTLPGSERANPVYTDLGSWNCT